MKERIYGTEALKILPFREVALPIEAGVRKLTSYRVTSVMSNTQFIIDSKVQGRGFFSVDPLMLRASSSEKIDSINTFPKGISFFREEISDLLQSDYSLYDILSFSCDYFFPDLISNPEYVFTESSFLGYIFDLFLLVRPDIASFDDCTKVLVESIKDSPVGFINFHYLGSLVDKARKFKPIKKETADFNLEIAIETVNEFDEAVRRNLKGRDLTEYFQGMSEVDIVLKNAQRILQRDFAFSEN